MKKILLMPNVFKKIGWVLFIPCFVWGLSYVLDLDYIENLLPYSWSDEVCVIGLAVSMLMIGFSREKDEDEYTATLRSYYLTLAFYIDTAIIIGTLTLYEFDYISFMLIQMFLVLLLYIVIFNIAIWRIRKANQKTGHEE